MLRIMALNLYNDGAIHRSTEATLLAGLLDPLIGSHKSVTKMQTLTKLSQSLSLDVVHLIQLTCRVADSS